MFCWPAKNAGPRPADFAGYRHDKRVNGTIKLERYFFLFTLSVFELIFYLVYLFILTIIQNVYQTCFQMILFLWFCQKFDIYRRPASQQICGMTTSEKLNGWLAGRMCGNNLNIEK